MDDAITIEADIVRTSGSETALVPVASARILQLG
jgi:hypothetical protein